MGPLPVTSKVKNSIYSGYNPSYPFIGSFIGVLTPFSTGSGPPCRFPAKVAHARNKKGPGTPSEKLTSKNLLFPGVHFSKC